MMMRRLACYATAVAINANNNYPIIRVITRQRRRLPLSGGWARARRSASPTYLVCPHRGRYVHRVVFVCLLLNVVAAGFRCRPLRSRHRTWEFNNLSTTSTPPPNAGRPEPDNMPTKRCRATCAHGVFCVYDIGVLGGWRAAAGVWSCAFCGNHCS